MNLERLQKISERTFLDIVDALADTNNIFVSIVLKPYDGIVFLQTTLLTKGHQDTSKWYLKTLGEKPEEIYDDDLKSKCYKIVLGLKEFRTLKKVSSKNGPTYFALSIRKKDAEYFISEFAPSERFDWFVLDLKEYFSIEQNNKSKRRSLCIPQKNALNLARSLLNNV